MKSLLPPELQSTWGVRDTQPRRNRMAELAFAGYRIPRCGLFRDMERLGVPLVVYTDEHAHCGEGKRLYRPDADRPPPAGFPGLFSSVFIDTRVEGLAFSTRRLVVGDLVFFVDYESRVSWMSNVGGEYKVRPLPTGGPLRLNRDRDPVAYPMYAIDFLIVDGGDDIAVDLNTCPGVPVEAVNLVGRDVLTASVRDFCRRRGLIV